MAAVNTKKTIKEHIKPWAPAATQQTAARVRRRKPAETVVEAPKKERCEELWNKYYVPVPPIYMVGPNGEWWVRRRDGEAITDLSEFAEAVDLFRAGHYPEFGPYIIYGEPCKFTQDELRLQSLEKSKQLQLERDKKLKLENKFYLSNIGSLGGNTADKKLYIIRRDGKDTDWYDPEVQEYLAIMKEFYGKSPAKSLAKEPPPSKEEIKKLRAIDDERKAALSVPSDYKFICGTALKIVWLKALREAGISDTGIKWICETFEWSEVGVIFHEGTKDGWGGDGIPYVKNLYADYDMHHQTHKFHACCGLSEAAAGSYRIAALACLIGKSAGVVVSINRSQAGMEEDFEKFGYTKVMDWMGNPNHQGTTQICLYLYTPPKSHWKYMW